MSNKKKSKGIKSYDILIVGSGVAGSLCGYILRKLGYKTLLIEKYEHPRQKPCGGGVSKSALEQLPFLIPKRLIESYVNGIRIVDPKSNSYEFIINEFVGVKVIRKYFDEFLIKKAVNSGASLIENIHIKGIIPFDDRYLVMLSDGREISSKYIIGADGVNSSVARLTGIRRKWNPEEIGVTQRCFAKVKNQSVASFMGGNKNILELHFTQLPMGYGWVFPLKNKLNIGIGGRAKELISERKRGINHLEEFIQMVKRSRNNKFELEICDIQGHLIPAGGFKRQVGKENILLIGDAGGFVDPLSGEGIRYAFLSARIAVKSIRMAEKKQTYAIEYYEDLCNEAITKNLNVALKYTYFIHNHLNLFFKVLQYFPIGARFFKEMAEGLTYPELRIKGLKRFLQIILRLPFRVLGLEKTNGKSKKRDLRKVFLKN